MERFLACDKVPQDARDGARQGIDAMKNSWGDTPSMPAGVGRVANDACLQAIDMLEQGVAAMGCRI